MNANKTKFRCFHKDGTVPLLNGKALKLVDLFTYLGSNISSTESDVSIHKGRQANGHMKI